MVNFKEIRSFINKAVNCMGIWFGRTLFRPIEWFVKSVIALLSIATFLKVVPVMVFVSILLYTIILFSFLVIMNRWSSRFNLTPGEPVEKLTLALERYQDDTFKLIIKITSKFIGSLVPVAAMAPWISRLAASQAFIVGAKKIYKHFRRKKEK